MGLIILAVLIGGGVVLWRIKNAPGAPELTAVRRGTIVQEVHVTGQVRSASKVDLKFNKSGKVVRVNVDVGSSVAAGTVLAELTHADLDAQLLEAQANVAVQRAQVTQAFGNVETQRAQVTQLQASVATQRAKLDDLKRPARAEDIRVKESELRKAEQDLANVYASIPDALNDAYTKADDAVRKQTDPLFSNDEETTPILTFTAKDSQAKIDAESQRAQMTALLGSWKNELASLGPAPAVIPTDNALAAARSRLLQIRTFLSRCTDAVTSAITVSADTLNTYKTNLNTGRTNVDTAVASLNAQTQSIASQKLVVERLENELALKKVGATPEAIAAQEAQVAQAVANVKAQEALVRQAEANVTAKQAAVQQAEAGVASIRAQIADTVLVSPIAGLVAARNIEPGEMVTGTSNLISIIAQSDLEIEANVPEVDIGKIHVGDPVEIGLDAHPGKTFRGRVGLVDPAETVVDGVINYRIKVYPDGQNEQYKSGFTANLAIETDRKENVLVLPQYAIVEKDDGKFVQLSAGKSFRLVPVTLGIRGSDGLVEIAAGLGEGDAVENVGAKKK